MVALLDKPGHPPHARRQVEGSLPSDETLVGTSALDDPTAWCRVDWQWPASLTLVTLAGL